MLRALLRLAGQRVLDVGCGGGALVRFMTRAGAEVIGLESSTAQLGRARDAAPAGGERYLAARGEALPFAAATMDAVVLFNSLHHIAVPCQAAALTEAARVLRPGGALFIQEPVAAGGYFEMMRPVEDETEVRAKAYEATRAAAAGPAFAQEAEVHYRAPFKHRSFESFTAALIAVDPRRREALEARRASLEAAFEALAERRDGAYWFEAPARVNLLRRLAERKDPDR